MRKFICYLIFLSPVCKANDFYFREAGVYVVLGKVEVYNKKTKLILLENTMTEIDLNVLDQPSKNYLNKLNGFRVLACAKIIKPCGQICESDKVEIKKNALPWERQTIPDGFFKMATKKICP